MMFPIASLQMVPIGGVVISLSAVTATHEARMKEISVMDLVFHLLLEIAMDSYHLILELS